MTMKKDAFFMVYLEGGRGPEYRHETYVSAATEAKRLARKFGRKAYVLTTVRSYQTMEFHEEDLMPSMEEIDELPF